MANRIPALRPLLDYCRQHFVLDLNGLHGPRHWGRVYANGIRIANAEGANPLVPSYFAFVHDSCRTNDDVDYQHGPDAAEFALKLRALDLLPMSNEEFDLLTFACRHHSDGFTEAPLEVQICWDADRLDLFRVGYYPDPKRLCTAYAKQEQVIRAAVARSCRS